MDLCVDLGPWGTCEVFNEVKQVQRNRMVKPRQSEQVSHTLPRAHHRTGTAEGGDKQIALSFFVPSLSLEAV